MQVAGSRSATWLSGTAQVIESHRTGSICDWSQFHLTCMQGEC